MITECFATGSIPSDSDTIFVHIDPKIAGDGIRNLDNGVSSNAIATTEHATSSYGVPVIVLRDGTALGTAEMQGGIIVCVDTSAIDDNSMFTRLVRAGYNVVAEQI